MCNLSSECPSTSVHPVQASRACPTRPDTLYKVHGDTRHDRILRTSFMGTPDKHCASVQASRVCPTRPYILYKPHGYTRHDHIICTSFTGIPDTVVHPRHRGSGAPKTTVHPVHPKLSNLWLWINDIWEWYEYILSWSMIKGIILWEVDCYMENMMVSKFYVCHNLTR